MPTINKKYYNFYQKKEMIYPITYTLQPGFSTLDEARSAISKKWNPDFFTYISVDKEIYAVAIETLGRQIVITKGKCFYRNGEVYAMQVRANDAFCMFEDYLNIPTEINNPRITNPWASEVIKDLDTLFNVEILSKTKCNTQNTKFLPNNSLVLLAKVLFDTMVPVYELGVMDAYCENPGNSPSRWKLWQNGVESFNYFNGEVKYSDHKPYRKEDYFR